MQLLPGDKVRIRRDSMFSYQSSDIGTVLYKRFDCESSDTWYKVCFPNITDSYRDIDLEIIEQSRGYINAVFAI